MSSTAADERGVVPFPPAQSPSRALVITVSGGEKGTAEGRAHVTRAPALEPASERRVLFALVRFPAGVRRLAVAAAAGCPDDRTVNKRSYLSQAIRRPKARSDERT